MFKLFVMTTSNSNGAIDTKVIEFERKQDADEAYCCLIETYFNHFYVEVAKLY